MPVILQHKTPLGNKLNANIKRIFDICVATTCIVVTSPVMLAIYIVLKITTTQPPIFRQQRIGYALKPFCMYKFCTMNPSSENNKSWTSKQDTRRTPFGSFLRRYSLDELPQFFNVLQGNMSIIGPRPEQEVFVQHFEKSIPQYTLRHGIKPGISGLAQINRLRGDTSIMQRTESDIFYIENWSLLLDIKILFRTITKAFYNPNE